MKINIKLGIAFFFIAFLSISIIGVMAYFKGKASLEKESFNRLTAVREMKSVEIEDYFNDINNQIVTFSEDHMIIEALWEFKRGFDTLTTEVQLSDSQIVKMEDDLTDYYNNVFLSKLNQNLEIDGTIEEHLPKDLNSQILQSQYIINNPNEVGSKHYLDKAGSGTYYDKAHEIYHPLIRNYCEKFGYYDIFLVDDETGHVLYTVYKEVDLGISLIEGPYKHSNISKAFTAARDSEDEEFVKLVDFEPYHPSYNNHASFIASPIFHEGEKFGVLIFQMPIDRINEIMTNRHEWKDVGLGNSGETYIVSSDYTLRNQSRFFIEDQENYLKMLEELGTNPSTLQKIKNFKSTIGLQEAKTEGTEAALSGVTDTRIFKDYRGVEVLSSFKPLEILDMHWAIMSEIDKDEAFAHVYDLRRNIIIIVLGLLIAIVFISFFISKKITKPIKTLTVKAQELAAGNLDVDIPHLGEDEIGVLSDSFSNMQHSIKDLVDELQDINHNLELKVEERTAEIQTQKHMVEEKNKEIVDSINYALRLQKAILPSQQKIKTLLPDSFVLFLPKDIVSGDFYWMQKIGGKVLVAAVDCTGHGVPGAMVSVVGANGLNRCIREFSLKKPNKILDKLTEIVEDTFDNEDDDVKDGMDCALCSIDLEKRTVDFSGANNPLWILRDGAHDIEEIKGDKQPIGKFDFRQPFTDNTVQLGEGDCIYFFSDGYADQFGGERGKKMKYKTLKKILLENKHLSMDEQKLLLINKFMDWKGDLEQLDDVCIIGVRF